MKLSDSFWKGFELDIQEAKIAYLKWAISNFKEPPTKYRHLLLWDHQKDFCIVNSRYGRAFGISPLGTGSVRGLPKIQIESFLDNRGDAHSALRKRIACSTYKIREAIIKSLETQDLESAREGVLNWHWLKFGPHELLFDRVQYGGDEEGKLLKGRWGLDESEGFRTLMGIHNRIINVIRFGEYLDDEYVMRLNHKLPGVSRGSQSVYISVMMVTNRRGSCIWDCGPVLWSKLGFVNFNMVKERMNKLGWPYRKKAFSCIAHQSDASVPDLRV
jgi:hypothetical protein